MKRFLILMAMLGSLCLWAQKPDPKAIIGKIDDKAYTYAEYETILNNYFRFHNPQNKKLSDEEKAKLNDQCWEELIGRYVYDKAIKAGKIKLTDAQVLAEAKRNPPAEVKQIKELQTKGKFDAKLYEKALTDVPEFRKQVIALVRSIYQYTKLLDTVKAEVDVSADSVKAAWMKENDTVDARIIFFDYKKLTNLEASEQEALLFYSERREEFRKDDGRSLRYVKFANAATPADSTLVQNQVQELYQELLAGRDFAQAAKDLSADPGSGKNGGELGWFTRGRMVRPFEDAAFSTPVGELSQPVLSNFGWHIIKVTGKREGGQGEEVEASHILIKISPSEKTLQDMKINSHQLHTLALQTGLQEAALQKGCLVEETPAFFQTEGFIPGFGREARLISFAYENPPDTLFEIYYSPSGDAYVIETAQEFPTWYPDFEEKKSDFITSATNTKRMYTMEQTAEGYIENLEPGDYLDQANKDQHTIIEIKAHKSGDNISSIGIIAPLDNALLNTAAGQFTPLIKDNNRWFLAFIDARHKPDTKTWEKQKTKLIEEARKELRQKHLNDWYYKERQKVSIIDNRADFYDLKSTRKMIQL